MTDTTTRDALLAEIQPYINGAPDAYVAIPKGLLRRLHAALADDGWRDIAEAPRDGTCVQVWTGTYQHTAWYDDNLPGWCAMADDVELVFQPTHFRDLPAPPREK